MLKKRPRFLFVSLCSIIPVIVWASTVTSIDFKSASDSSEIDIQSDGPVSFQKSENSNDKQIVLDLKGSTLAKNASRNLDTSSFDSKVLLVSPYSVGDDSSNSRVVIQLREMASANVTQDGNLLKITVPNSGKSAANDSATTSASAPATTAAATQENASSAAVPDAPPGSEDAPATPAASAQTTEGVKVQGQVIEEGSKKSTASSRSEESPHIKDKLDQFIDSRETRRFTGSPITLKVRDADVTDVFRLIAESSGFNIVLGEDVKGKITMSVEGVPWDQALDVILHTQKLGAERNNNILRIVGLANLTAEKQAELSAKIAAEASAPRVTRVFPISYAKLEDLVTILQKFSSVTTNAPGATGATAAAPATTVVQLDARTNSIIVRDIPENIERVKKLIEILDTQTPQVLIESKIVEATETFSKSIGGSLGFGAPNSNSQFFSSFAGGDPIDPLFANGTVAPVFSGGAAASGASSTSSSSSTGGPVPGGNFGVSPQLAFLPSSMRLNALLNLAESESSIKIISAPRTVVLDKESASIVESTPVQVPALTSTQNGPVSTSTIAQANLSLNVVPTITNEGSVIMQLNVSDDVPFPLAGGTQAVANRNITTRVLVESGSTLVMGGIYTVNITKNSSGFPFLRNIPIIGALFGNELNSDARTELFFFITPRILNLKEAGVTQT
jgi:type IV pilus assembly protein PilQ